MVEYYFEPEDIQKVINTFRNVHEYSVNLNRPSITVKCKGRLDSELMQALRDNTYFYVGFVYARPLETLEVICDLDRDKWERSGNKDSG